MVLLSVNLTIICKLIYVYNYDKQFNVNENKKISSLHIYSDIQGNVKWYL